MKMITIANQSKAVMRGKAAENFKKRQALLQKQRRLTAEEEGKSDNSASSPMQREGKEKMREIQIFENAEFGKVRTIVIDNEPWFVGKDIATALGYAKPENAIANHVDEEDKTSTLIRGSGSNYKSKTIVINESGVCKTLPKGCNPGKGCFNCPYPDCINPDSFRLSEEEKVMLECGSPIPRAIQRKREYKRAYYRQHRQEIYERTQAYYQKHRQEIREYNQAYRQQHRQEMREYNRAYYQKHRQKILGYQRAYRQQHRQEIRERNQAYRQKHRQEIRERNQAYRQKHRQEILDE